MKRSLEDGTIGEPVSALVSRHITRNLGKKISGRVKLSPAAMESTHDIDFMLWCLAPRKPIRVYAQEAAKIMKAQYNAPDCVWMIVTMDDGTVFTIGGGWVLPPAYPNFSSTWIEFVGTEGAVMVDDTHRDVYVTTMKDGIRFPISSMPGEKVNHVYAGPMEAETLHFLECVALGKQPLVTAEHARMVMQIYKAADQSVETNKPVDLVIAGAPDARHVDRVDGRRIRAGRRSAAEPLAPRRQRAATRTRWWMLVLFSLMYLICYLDRGIISVAQPEIRETFGLTLAQMGLVLAAFTWAYAVGQVPVGWLGDRFGPKKVLNVLIAWTSTSAMLTGAVDRVQLAARGAAVPRTSARRARFPWPAAACSCGSRPSERGRIQGITHFFSRFAVAITPLTAGGLVLAYGWRVMFFVFGAIGFLWVAAFWWFYRERPEDHPQVNRAELAQIRGVNADGSIEAGEHVAPGDAVAPDPHVAEHVVDRARLLLLLLRHELLSDLVPDLPARVPRAVTGRRSASGDRSRSSPGMLGDIVGGSLSDIILKRTGNAKLARRGVAAPGFLLAGVFVVPAAMVGDATTVDPVPRHLVLLPRVGDRSGVGGADGRRRPLQRDGHRRHEHGGRAGRDR